MPKAAIRFDGTRASVDEMIAAWGEPFRSAWHLDLVEKVLTVKVGQGEIRAAVGDSVRCREAGEYVVGHSAPANDPV